MSVAKPNDNNTPRPILSPVNPATMAYRQREFYKLAVAMCERAAREKAAQAEQAAD